jgi:hypothetical protein
MKIIINETGAVETLSIIGAKSGLNYISDFVGNQGALSDGQFVWDEDQDAYVCDQETFDWWQKVVEENQELEYRIHELKEEHGSDEVDKVLEELGSVDLGDLASEINSALSEAFPILREVSSLTLYTFSIADDTDADSEARAEKLESLLEEEFPDSSVSVIFSKSDRHPVLEVEFEDIDEDDEEKYESEEDAFARVERIVAEVNEELGSDYGDNEEEENA